MLEGRGIEPGQVSKAGRDGLAVIGPVVIVALIENAADLGTVFGIDAGLIVLGATFVASLFGWRTMRKS